MIFTEEEKKVLTKSLQRSKVDVYREISKLYRDRRMTDDLGRHYDAKVNDLDDLIRKINN